MDDDFGVGTWELEGDRFTFSKVRGGLVGIDAVGKSVDSSVITRVLLRGRMVPTPAPTAPPAPPSPEQESYYDREETAIVRGAEAGLARWKARMAAEAAAQTEKPPV